MQCRQPILKRRINVRKQGGKRFLAVMLVVAAAMTQVLSVNASTMSKAKDAKKAAESDLNKANSQIETIEKQQQALQNEIDAKDAELVNLLVNIGILEDELDSKNAQLEQVTADLAKAEQTEADQYASMKKRIQFMYERGDTAMIESLLGSENMADFLNRVEYVSEVYDYDRNLLTQYQTTVQQVADLKSTVETEKAELEAMEDEYAAQQTELENVLAAKKARMGDYNNQLATAQAEAEAYKKTIAAQNKIIKEEERKQKEQEEKARAAAAKASAGNSNSSTSGTGNTGNSTGGTSSNSTGSSGGGENPSYSTSVSGSSVVSYACQFVGNPYVWGGTSLTNGADCSGFVMSVFAHFGVSLPHSSGALQGCGKAVSYANAQPGDLICYSGHVAIYMGGGQIVHAQSTAVGITTSSATYRTIVAVRRVL
ncbi:C40 family peptidase [Roseburia sp. BX1005]|uniref:C40 family peptidase n=1 Tax=Roseburia zhanii TaxID=2763064 RepID=A0A923LNS6_9FIRM|nr:C40 family peptidase [Roseburia zhanii]